jgi:hypothetical protein
MAMLASLGFEQKTFATAVPTPAARNRTGFREFDPFDRV